jgi:Polyphosphate kinase 2 (PPK2)/Cation transporter/ATPase, N-terminus
VKRLTKYGPNEIKEEKQNPLLKFLSYFWGPIPWTIKIAVVLSGVVRHWPDLFIILLLLVANAVVGFWEEHEAGNAITALKAKLAIKARVKRDGKWRKRFLERIDEPEKNWKFSMDDIKEWGFWKQYMKAYEKCLSATSTKDSPWYIVSVIKSLDAY